MVSVFIAAFAFAAPVPDTGQTKCYNDTVEIPCPSPGQPFYGQDANYSINPMSYTKLDGSGNALPDSATSWVMVRDNVTGLIWEMKTNKDGSKTTTILTMRTTLTPGTTATRLPMVAMPEHQAMARIPKILLKP